MQSIRARNSGATLIAVGMSLLVLAMIWPEVPAVTAMALVAMGATDFTLSRFSGSPAIVPVLLLHAATYGGLYALFVGAALHAAATSPGATLGVASVLDLAASTIPAAAAVRAIAVGIVSPLISER